MQTFTLKNGVEIPSLGYGTYLTASKTAAEVVEEALAAGYRHIDAAAIYGNEQEVGEGIKKSGLPRESIFVTSKLWNANRGYETTKKAFQQTLADLQLDYLDLYLIHWPANAKQFPETWASLNSETWRAFEDLYKAGKIKAIGVSNFDIEHLESLFKTATIKPMVNQIELHPGYPQREQVAFNKAHDILVEAWGPLGQSRLINNDTLVAIGQKHQKSSAQVCLRWSLQQGFLPLAKSVTSARIIENFDIWDFELDVEDMKTIDALQEQGWSGLRPAEVDF